MAWVDLEYYKNAYLLGSEQLIPDKDFPFYEKKAEAAINWKHVEVDNPQNCLKECICEVAELIYKNASKQEIHNSMLLHLSNTEYHNDFVYRGM